MYLLFGLILVYCLLGEVYVPLMRTDSGSLLIRVDIGVPLIRTKGGMLLNH